MESESREETAPCALLAPQATMTDSVVAITTVPNRRAVRHGLPERELDASRHSGRIDVLHGEVF